MVNSIGLTIDGESIGEASEFIDLARNSLVSSNDSIVKPAHYRERDIRQFISEVNKRYTQMLLENIGGDVERVDLSDVVTYSVPQQIGGLETWISSHNHKSKWLPQLVEGDNIPVDKLISYGVTASVLMESGIKFSDLLNRNGYTVRELGELKLTWEGFLAIGLTVHDFIEGESCCRISDFCVLFGWLSFFDLLLIEPMNLSPPEKIQLILSIPFAYHELRDLRFDFLDFGELMSPSCLKNMMSKFKMIELIDLGLTDRLLAKKDVYRRSVFNEVSWDERVFSATVKGTERIKEDVVVATETPERNYYRESDRVIDFPDESPAIPENPYRIRTAPKTEKSSARLVAVGRGQHPKMNRRVVWDK
jgi:hypothetical protein